MNARNKVFEILRDLSGTEKISENDRLSEDIGLDSLGMVSMLLCIEEKFNILLDESDMNPMDLKTVSDVISMTEKYIGNIV